MQELAKALSTFTQAIPETPTLDLDGQSPFAILQRAGEQWAMWSLRHMRDEHLRAALGISEAIAQFVTVELDTMARSRNGK